MINKTENIMQDIFTSAEDEVDISAKGTDTITEKSFTFIPLASGSSGNCYFLQSPEMTLLIDAGIGPRIIKKRLKLAGHNLEEVQGVLVTHDHADHIKGLGYLGEKLNIPIYATEICHDGINRSYCMTQRLTTSAHIITKDCSFELGDMTVTPFDVPHDASDNVGYRIELGHKVFCLATDIGAVTDAISHQITQAQYLVIEANYDEDMLDRGPYPAHLKQRIKGGKGHLSNNKCADLLSKQSNPLLKHVWLCHLSQDNNHPMLAKKTIEQGLLAAGRLVNEEVLIDVLKRQAISGVFKL